MYHVSIYWSDGSVTITRVYAKSRGQAIAQARWSGGRAGLTKVRFSAVKVG
jgi:hypothetical protein